MVVRSRSTSYLLQVALDGFPEREAKCIARDGGGDPAGDIEQAPIQLGVLAVTDERLQEPKDSRCGLESMQPDGQGAIGEDDSSQGRARRAVGKLVQAVEGCRICPIAALPTL
jgi:hypothetical protein